MKERIKQIKSIREGLPGQLGHVFGEAIELESIPLAKGSRQRDFDTRTTFMAFLGQVMRGGSQREGVREVQACRARVGLEPVSENTAAYSKARSRLPLPIIEEVHQRLCGRIEREKAHVDRRVVAIDGSSAQLADTAANQLDYPQHPAQSPGCGWPIMQMVGLYDLESGALLRVADSAQTDNENSWFQVDLIHEIRDRDVVLMDRGFCSFLNFGLILGRGADVVARLHAGRKVPFRRGEKERIVSWKRPVPSATPEHILLEEWQALPKEIEVRYIRFRVEVPGFRSREIILATTFLDTPAEELIELYRRRWEMELCFRDLKTTLGMEWMNCRSPEMAQKQMLMFLIVHNLIRWLLQRASRSQRKPLRRLSFKGALDSLLRWVPEIHAMPRSQRKSAFRRLLQSIADDLLPVRPNRCEPRRQKRRAKFSFLTRHRREYPLTQTA